MFVIRPLITFPDFRGDALVGRQKSTGTWSRDQRAAHMMELTLLDSSTMMTGM